MFLNDEILKRGILEQGKATARNPPPNPQGNPETPRVLLRWPQAYTSFYRACIVPKVGGIIVGQRIAPRKLKNFPSFTRHSSLKVGAGAGGGIILLGQRIAPGSSKTSRHST